MTAKQKRSVVALCISFAMVQASVALYAAFMTLYLEDMGFNAAQRGVLLALGPCVAILTQTMWGSVADRAKNKVRVVAVMAAGIALAGALFLLADLPIIGASGRMTAVIIVLALVLLIFFQNPVQPLVDTLVLEYIRRSPISRAELAARTQLTRASITQIIDSLFHKFAHRITSDNKICPEYTLRV